MLPNQGDISAILALAEIHFDGLNGHTDYAKAKKWYDKAAEQQNGIAEMQLSKMYDKGLGVKPDKKEAIRWLELAVQHYSSEAYYVLGKRMLEGRDLPQDTKEGLVLIKTGASRRYPEATFFMGLAYRDGIGVPKDQEKAQGMLSQALSGAIGQEDKEQVEKILNEGGNPNAHFQRAVFMPHPKTLVNYINGTEKAPEMEQVPVLASAIEHQNLEIASLLLENGAKPNAKLTISQRSVFWVAAEFGNVELMKLLVQYGVDINAPSAAFHKSPSQTPLDIALENGQTEGVAYLQSLGADRSPASSRFSGTRSGSVQQIEYRDLETDKPVSASHSQARRISTPVPDYFEELKGNDAPQAISNWYESEKRRYRALLAKQQFDILVVPMQVQRFAVDPIGRSMMTAYVVDYLRKATDKRIPDPTVIAKVLGEPSRTYKKHYVYKLAKELNVETIVWGHVGHDRAFDMRYTLQVQRKDDAGLHKFTPMIQWDSEVLTFSDENPPENVFSKLVPVIAKRIDPTIRKDTQPIPSVPTTLPELSLPEDPLAMVSAVQESPIAAAYHLQLLGTLFPVETERERERLFERSLVALTRLDSKNPEIPLLKARALFHLHRRPAALKAISEPKNPSEKAMVALLHGNLPELEEQISHIQSPLKKLLALIEQVDLRHYYERTPTIPDAAYIFAKQLPEWSQVILRRFKDLNEWSIQSNLGVKKSLDKIFPVKRFALEDIAAGHEIQNEFDLDKIDKTVELSIVRHFRKFLQRTPERWCCQHDLGRLQPWDLLTLFVSIGEANILKSISYYVGVQALPERAKRLLNQYSDVYAGHPGFTELHARTLFKLFKTEDPENKRNLQQRYEQEAYQAALWAGGQTRSAASALETSTKTVSEYKKAQLSFELPYPDCFPLYSRDVPHRAYWPIFESRFRYLDPNYHRNLGLSLKYTHHDIWYLTIVHEESPSREDAQALLAANQHRFIGHPRRVQFLAETKRETGNDAEALRLYQQAINEGEQGWDTYNELGSLYVKKGQYEEALNVFRQYPGFHDTTHASKVALSNHAYEAGSLLFWRGASEEAKVLYRISANLDTKSDGSLASAVRLAFMKGDYLSAAQDSLYRAKRYNSQYAYRDYLTLLHLLGFSEVAWKGFDALLGKFTAPQIWTSAFIGHRLQGTVQKGLSDWLVMQHDMRNPQMKKSHAARFAFMINTIDRFPDQRMIEHIAQLEKGFEAHVSSPGAVLNKANHLVGPSIYKQFHLASLDIGSNPESELVLFAKAYLALRQKNYDAAFSYFEEKGRFYSYRYGVDSLPYFAWAAVKTGKMKDLRQFLDDYEKPTHIARLGYTKGFDYFLSEAFIAGGQGRHQDAMGWLHNAFNHRPHTEGRRLFSWHQIVEACEWLYEESGRSEYRELALKWAKEYQVIQPMFAWAYAVEAKYSDDANARRKALAFALHLDAGSERIQEISDEEKAKARKWFKFNNPFLQNLHLHKTKQLKS